MLYTNDYAAVFELLAQTPSQHAAHTAFHRALAPLCAESFRNSPFGEAQPHAVPFGPFGDFMLPYWKMGAIDSIDLFGLNELLLFAFYNANRGRYHQVVDIGANLGVHTILLARCGFKVRAYEPDPIHYDLLTRNVRLNGQDGIELIQAAVSDHAGQAEFVRVVGNTTGSHLAGAKSNPYGDLERFQVEMRAFPDSVASADFVKIDAEGHEVVILKSLPQDRWRSLDAVVEIGTSANAAAIFDHFAKCPVTLFSQKIGWSPARTVADLPTSHREGSVFISSRSDMGWSV